MSNLNEYAVKFRQNTLLETWHYTIECPNGENLINPLGFGFVSKDKAEESALRQIKIHQSNYTMSGEELKEKLDGRQL